MSAIYEDANCCVLVAPLQRGALPSLIGIKKRNTGTRRTEVHVRSPESNYEEFSLNVGTGLHETHRNFTFRMADWTGNGQPDLWAIKKWATGTGKTEVHIYSAETNYAEAVFHGSTPLEETGDHWDFEISYAGRDVPPDLVGIKRASTGTNSTELHFMSGRHEFSQFSLQTGTALHETGTGRDWNFLMSDFNRNGKADFVTFSPANNGEIHVAGGPDFQQFYYQKILDMQRQHELLSERDEALKDAFISCTVALGSFIGTLAVIPTPAGIIAAASTRIILMGSLMSCLDDVGRYNRATDALEGRGGQGRPEHEVDPFDNDRPHPEPPSEPPAPVPPPEPPEPPVEPPVEPPSDPADPGPAPIPIS